MEAHLELIWNWLFCLWVNVMAFGNITSLENHACWWGEGILLIPEHAYLQERVLGNLSSLW